MGSARALYEVGDEKARRLFPMGRRRMVAPISSWPTFEGAMVGKRLSPFNVLEKPGEGGISEVYRARDEHLGRDVAIKVLPAAVAGDPDRCRWLSVRSISMRR